MRSIKQLSAEANAYPFSPAVSFPSWVHVCQTLQREARVYDAENDPEGLERAYILYLRLADLVLNRLPRHPQFHQYRAQYTQVVNQIPGAMDRSENLKKRLAARVVASPARAEPARSPLGIDSSDPSGVPSGVPRRSEYGDELETADDPIGQGTAEPLHIALDDSLRATLNSLKNPSRPSAPPKSYAASLPNYPAVRHSPLTPQGASTGSLGSSASHSIPGAAYQPPEAHHQTGPQSPKDAGVRQSSPYEHKSVYTTEKGDKLRPLFVPANLRSRFLELAAKNTRANLETCGILCGKLNRNAFFVTDLVVPYQTSTSDSCDMTNEEELFDYADKRDLFIFGWIHTHPSQSCFMSSIDLHTQAGYQIMLPEAIAIVCAPTADPSWGVFRLTDPPGIDVIKSCHLTGFHPHSQPNLYKLARPGHVKEIAYDFADKDLRGT